MMQPNINAALKKVAFCVGLAWSAQAVAMDYAFQACLSGGACTAWLKSPQDACSAMESIFDPQASSTNPNLVWLGYTSAVPSQIGYGCALEGNWRDIISGQIVHGAWPGFGQVYQKGFGDKYLDANLCPLHGNPINPLTGVKSQQFGLGFAFGGTEFSS